MKKLLSVIIIALSMALLSGCGAKQEGNAETVGVPNPVKTHASVDEQIQAVGLGLEAPEGASDVRYMSINGMAETVFTLDGVEYFYRARPTGELEAFDMSGLYYTFKETGSGTVFNREAKAFVCDEAGFVQWLDVVPGINYNLGTVSKTSTDKLFETAKLVFVPAQGEAEG